MNDRDRLIELLADSGCSADLDTYQELADHLLANGVIVPPCKAGEFIYFIYANKVYQVKVEIIKIFQKSMVVKGIMWDDIKLEWRDCLIPNIEIGKTVFLTKEDAEQALKEREG